VGLVKNLCHGPEADIQAVASLAQGRVLQEVARKLREVADSGPRRVAGGARGAAHVDACQGAHPCRGERPTQ